MCLLTLAVEKGYVTVLEAHESGAIGRAAVDAEEHRLLAGGPTLGRAEGPMLEGAVGFAVTRSGAVTVVRDSGRFSADLFGWTFASRRGP